MSDDLHALQDDLAYLRQLAGGGKAELAREGVLLFTVGVIFAAVDLIYWAYSADVLHLGASITHLPWIAGVLLSLICVFIIKARLPHVPSASARAIGAASAGVGYGVLAAVPSLIAGAFAIHEPKLVIGVFPLVVLILYGSVWIVAYAVMRRPVLALVAVGCFIAALACGFAMGRAAEWLILATAMLVLVALPGAGMARS